MMDHNALSRIETEVAYREVIFKALDTVIRDKFTISLEGYKRGASNKLRRDVVHKTILGERGASGGNWRMKKLISEKLVSMGVGQLLSTGKRWYTGICLKQKTN